jgi:hypothetical protein
MMKNIEWGAAVYISQSIYGKNSEMWVNNSDTDITGCAGNTLLASPYVGCESTYNTANGIQASTTGNIYGLYDINGGSWEYTATYIDNANESLIANGSSIVNGDNKYKDIYRPNSSDTNTSNYEAAINKKGDVIYETSSDGTDSLHAWNNECSHMVNNANTYFIRSGDAGTYTYSGGFATLEPVDFF